MLQKSDPKSHLASLEQQKTQQNHFKVAFPPLPPSRLLQNIWSLVRSRPSLKAIMNYISRDIITQEPWTNAPWFKFYRFFFFPSRSSNFCLRWTQKVFLQNAQWGVMLIKVIGQWLGTTSFGKKAFIPTPPHTHPSTLPALQVLRPGPSTCLAFISAGVKDIQNAAGWLREGSWDQLGILGPSFAAKAPTFHLNVKYASPTYLFTKIQKGFVGSLFPPETGNAHLGK